MKNHSRLLVAATLLASSSVSAATTWNGTAGNWLVGDATIWDSAFANGDTVTFGGTTGQTITVDGAGVAPTATTVSNTGTMVFSGGAIGGSFTKSGAGSVTLNSANSFSSYTQTAGTLNLRDLAATAGTYASLGSGTLSTAGQTANVVVSLGGNAGVATTLSNNITLGSGFRTELNVQSGSASTARDVTVSGLITGGASGATRLFINTDTSGGSLGAIRLTNSSNSFVGNIQINRGGLAITSDGALGDVGNSIFLDVGTATAVGLRFDAAMSSARAIQIGGGTQYFDTGANAVTLSGVISSGGNLTKRGTGVLTLSGNSNSYTGGTTINAGTVKVAAAGALGSGNVAINASGTLDMSGLAGASTLTKSIVLGGAGTTGLTVLSGSGNGTEFSGNITGTTATLFLNTSTVSDTEGLITLSGNNTFTASTGVQLNRGSLMVKSATALGATTNSVRLDSNTSAGGNLRFDNAVTTIANNITIITGGNTIAGTASGVTLSGVISGGAWQKVVAGTTLRLSGVNTASGTTVAAGTLNITSTGSINVSAAGGVSVTSGAILAVDGKLNVTAITATITNGGTINFAASGSSIVLGSVFDGLSGNTYQLISGAGSITNGTAVGFDLSGSAVWSSATLSNTGLVTFTAVPEPSTYGLMGAGALAAVAMVRRRRKSA